MIVWVNYQSWGGGGIAYYLAAPLLYLSLDFFHIMPKVNMCVCFDTYSKVNELCVTIFI